VHYPYNPDAEDSQGIGAHTDYECFMLLKPTATGLEVLNRTGD
jgi:isopenicillin N synthase-like dioxygenase